MNKLIKNPIILVGLLLAIAIVLVVASETGKRNTGFDHKAAGLIRDHSPTLGSDNAKVTIVEFFDPACGTCKAFYPFVKRLMAKNPGKIRLVLRYAAFHEGSDAVVKLLEAARLQNKFWETLEAVYESQPIWVSNHKAHIEKLWMLLGGVGLNLKQAQADMEKPMMVTRLQQDMADARRLQVTKTPGFFVNGQPLQQFGYEPLQRLVESQISQNY
ncbi:MAG: thioredoxin domain-containing protein [Gammaproteobacteria bacterium]|nr:thioredoxin domain-containing protein [Gammaproteobacteria bacterium]MDH5799837.1 thioredoxin domain-containing protein [Gammaproteobacteria bacterium]